MKKINRLEKYFLKSSKIKRKKIMTNPSQATLAVLTLITVIKHTISFIHFFKKNLSFQIWKTRTLNFKNFNKNDIAIHNIVNTTKFWRNEKKRSWSRNTKEVNFASILNFRQRIEKMVFKIEFEVETKKNKNYCLFFYSNILKINNNSGRLIYGRKTWFSWKKYLSMSHLISSYDSYARKP